MRAEGSAEGEALGTGTSGDEGGRPAALKPASPCWRLREMEQVGFLLCVLSTLGLELFSLLCCSCSPVRMCLKPAPAPLSGIRMRSTRASSGKGGLNCFSSPSNRSFGGKKCSCQQTAFVFHLLLPSQGTHCKPVGQKCF